MPRACSVCTHEQLAAITKDLGRGDPIRQVASRYGLTHGSVQRHLANCMGVSRGQPKGTRPPERTGRGRLSEPPTPARHDTTLWTLRSCYGARIGCWTTRSRFSDAHQVLATTSSRWRRFVRCDHRSRCSCACTAFWRRIRALSSTSTPGA